MILAVDPVANGPAIAVDRRDDRPRCVVDAPHGPLEVVAVAVDVGADNLGDRIAQVVAEGRADSESTPRIDVDAPRERVAVVEVRTCVVLARVEIVGVRLLFGSAPAAVNVVVPLTSRARPSVHDTRPLQRAECA